MNSITRSLKLSSKDLDEWRAAAARAKMSLNAFAVEALRARIAAVFDVSEDLAKLAELQASVDSRIRKAVDAEKPRWAKPDGKAGTIADVEDLPPNPVARIVKAYSHQGATAAAAEREAVLREQVANSKGRTSEATFRKSLDRALRKVDPRILEAIESSETSEGATPVAPP